VEAKSLVNDGVKVFCVSDVFEVEVVFGFYEGFKFCAEFGELGRVFC
jgi:hypothetical protein